MSNLISENNLKTIKSLEVAEMVGKQHAHLMRDIDTYIMYISENPKLDYQDFFIESTYKTEGNNKTYKCYNITKKGCEFIAHKLTGQKGALFTASYINKFHELENNQQPQSRLEWIQFALEQEKERLIIEQERDEAIRTKAYISDKKTATTLGKLGGTVKALNDAKRKLGEGKDFASIKKVEALTGRKFHWKDLKDYSKNNEIEIIKVEDINYPKGVNAYNKEAWYAVYDINLCELF